MYSCVTAACGPASACRLYLWPSTSRLSQASWETEEPDAAAVITPPAVDAAVAVAVVARRRSEVVVERLDHRQVEGDGPFIVWVCVVGVVEVDERSRLRKGAGLSVLAGWDC